MNVPVHPSTPEDHAQPLQVLNDAPAPSSPIEADDEDEELPVAYTGYTPKSPTRIVFLVSGGHRALIFCSASSRSGLGIS